MNDLVSLFRNFIYRDLAFILGGSIVLLSTSHALRSYSGIGLHSLQDRPYALFLFTVLAYVVGYIVQDFFALLPWRPTFTGYVLEPGVLSQFLYWRFTAFGWQPVTFAMNAEEALRFVIGIRGLPEPTLRELERIRSLKVFSMCIGGCSFVSALIFVGKWSLDKWVWHSSVRFDWIAAILLLAFCAASICLGWVKALQEMQFYEAVNAVRVREASDQPSPPSPIL
jgi:hypothetical protein